MSDWSKERLDSLISDKVEENLELEYKSAGSLARTNDKREEITKDVSAFANSVGGVLIYGIRENGIAAERFDAVDRHKFRREWLEQVIQTIQPRLEGVTIQTIAIDHEENFVCYVVKIPQSGTAHMATDHRYYRRLNTSACPMEDYEVRDVMNRRKHPKVSASVFVNFNAIDEDQIGLVLLEIRNTGYVLAKHVMAEVNMPIRWNHDIAIDDSYIENEEGRSFFVFRMTPGIAAPPLFPGSKHTLRKKIRWANWHAPGGESLPSIAKFRLRIFADEMPSLNAEFDFASITAGWTPIPG